MAEDYTLPLGLDRPGPSRRRLRLLPVASALLVLVVGFLAGWAILFRDPHGGEPRVIVDLPVLPAALPAAAMTPAPPPPEAPEDNNGEIIIRDP